MNVSSVQSGGLPSLQASALRNLRGGSSAVSKNALRSAQGEVALKRKITVSQKMFIYSINLHLAKIADKKLGEVLDREA